MWVNVCGLFWRIEKSVNLCVYVCFPSKQQPQLSHFFLFFFTPSSSFLRSIFILALFSPFGRCWWLLSKSQSSILSIAFLWLLFVLVYLNKFEAREEWRHMPSWSTFSAVSLPLFSWVSLFSHLSSVRCDEKHDPSAATHPVASISSTGTSVVGEIRGWCRNHYIYAQIYTYIQLEFTPETKIFSQNAFSDFSLLFPLNFCFTSIQHVLSWDFTFMFGI